MAWLSLAQQATPTETDEEVVLLCDHIDDDNLRAAVCFAILEIRDGLRPDYANAEAAKEYNEHVSDVATHTGQHAQRVKEARKASKARSKPNSKVEAIGAEQWPAIGRMRLTGRTGAGIAIEDADTFEPLVELIEHPASVGRPWHYRVITTYGPDRVSWFSDGPEWWKPRPHAEDDDAPQAPKRLVALKDRGVLNRSNGWKTPSSALRFAVKRMKSIGWEVIGC